MHRSSSGATLPQPASVATAAPGGALWAIVFAGGIGSRFWPLSSPERPKAVLNLLSDHPLIADTIRRLEPVIPVERTLVLVARDIAPAVRAAIPDVPTDNVLIEPRPLGTAAALAWGLEVIRRRGGANDIVCAVHVDLAVGFPHAFRTALQRAASLALRHGVLVELGVSPTRPETAFGYAVPGERIEPPSPSDGIAASRVMRFVEKPSLDVVAELLTDGALWHAGIVVGQVQHMTDELFVNAPELAAGRDALLRGNMPAFAAQVRSVSVERALLERTTSLAVLPIECAWDDVGTWAALRRARDLDDDGNGAIGNVRFVDSESNVVHAEGATIVLFGCEQLLVVTLPGLTFVTTLERAAELRPLLDALPKRLTQSG